jgi:hypothetical protein
MAVEATPVTEPVVTPERTPEPVVEATGDQKKFGIVVPAEMHASLQRVAEEEGVSVSEVCRRALDAELKDNPTRTRKRLAQQVRMLADSLDAAIKAGHVKSAEDDLTQLRELADRLEKGEEGSGESSGGLRF